MIVTAEWKITYCLLACSVDGIVAGLLGVVCDVTFSLTRHCDVSWI
jgi:hypothetical protein